jgi:hypothetical protein
MSIPSLSFDPEWAGRPTIDSVAGTPGWVAVGHEIKRAYQWGGAPKEQTVRGFGCGLPDHAAMAALGEIVERFAASDPRVIRSLDHDDPPGPRIEAHRLHSSGLAFDSGWSRATGMITGSTVWIPTALCGIDYARTTGRRASTDVDSTGLAADSSLDDAARRGLGEVIERNAVGLWWRWEGRAHRLVRAPSACISAASRVGLTITTALVDSDGCGPVAVACISHSDGQEATLGSAWRGTEDEAMTHAIAEAFMIRATARAGLGDRGTRGLPFGLDRLVWGWDHGPEILRRLHESCSQPIVTTVGSQCGRVRAIFGVEPLCVPIAVVALGGRRMSVVRVLVPGAFRLESCLLASPHKSERLEQLGATLGGPHPFG